LILAVIFRVRRLYQTKPPKIIRPERNEHKSVEEPSNEFSLKYTTAQNSFNLHILRYTGKLEAYLPQKVMKDPVLDLTSFLLPNKHGLNDICFNSIVNPFRVTGYILHFLTHPNPNAMAFTFNSNDLEDLLPASAKNIPIEDQFMGKSAGDTFFVAFKKGQLHCTSIEKVRKCVLCV